MGVFGDQDSIYIGNIYATYLVERSLILADLWYEALLWGSTWNLVDGIKRMENLKDLLDLMGHGEVLANQRVNGLESGWENI